MPASASAFSAPSIDLSSLLSIFFFAMGAFYDDGVWEPFRASAIMCLTYAVRLNLQTSTEIPDPENGPDISIGWTSFIMRMIKLTQLGPSSRLLRSRRRYRSSPTSLIWRCN
jgi:hypothetical protein